MNIKNQKKRLQPIATRQRFDETTVVLEIPLPSYHSGFQLSYKYTYNKITDQLLTDRTDHLYRYIARKP